MALARDGEDPPIPREDQPSAGGDDDKAESDEKKTGDRPTGLLSPRQQAEYLELAELGAPPALACRRVGVTFEDVLETQARNLTFANRLETAQLLLAGNVEAAIYRSAMNGSVLAQTQFMRHCRPKPREINPAKEIPTDELKQLLAACARDWAKEDAQDSPSDIDEPTDLWPLASNL